MATYSAADGTKIVTFSMGSTNGASWTVFTVPPNETYKVIKASVTANYTSSGAITVTGPGGDILTGTSADANRFAAASNAARYQWVRASDNVTDGGVNGAGFTSTIGNYSYYERIFCPADTLVVVGTQSSYTYTYNFTVIATVHNG